MCEWKCLCVALINWPLDQRVSLSLLCDNWEKLQNSCSSYSRYRKRMGRGFDSGWYNCLFYCHKHISWISDVLIPMPDLNFTTATNTHFYTSQKVSVLDSELWFSQYMWIFPCCIFLEQWQDKNGPPVPLCLALSWLEFTAATGYCCSLHASPRITLRLPSPVHDLLHWQVTGSAQRVFDQTEEKKIKNRTRLEDWAIS